MEYGPLSIYSPSVSLTSTGTAVASPIPFDTQGYFPTTVRISTTADCYVEFGDIGVTAVVGDMLLQAGDAMVLNVGGNRAVSVLSVSGSATVTVQALEMGAWSTDQRTLDYAFTSLTELPSPVTFSRGSGGGAFGSDGLYKWYGYNLLTYSQDFSNAVTWVTGNSTLGSLITAPDGTATGQSIVENTASGTHETAKTATTVTSGATYTLSVYVKAQGRTACRVILADATLTSRISTDVNLSTGSASAAILQGGATAPSAPTCTAVGNGWYRVVVVGVLGAYTSSVQYFRASDTVGNVVYTGNGQAAIAIWGAQLELGSTASSYSPTTTAASGAPRFDYDPVTLAGVTGVELVTNGDFSQGSTGWVLASEWAVTNGQLVLTGTGALSTAIYNGTTGTVGKTYRVVYTVVSLSGGGGLTLQSGGSVNVRTGITAAGTYTDNVVCDSTLALFSFKRTSGAVSATIDNIAVQEVTFTPRGLLVEEQRTNLLLQSVLPAGTAGTVGSGAVAPTSWTFGFTGATVSFPVSRFGTNGVRFATTGATRSYLAQTVSVSASTTYVLSALVDTVYSGTLSIQQAVSYATMPAGATQTYTKNGVAVVGGTTFTTGDVISAVMVVSTTAGTAECRIGAGCVGDGTSGDFTFTAVQCEAGAFKTSYIPTTTASATRSADSCSMTGTNFSSWYSQAQGTFVVEFDSSAQSSADQFIFCTSVSGAGTNRQQMLRRSASSNLGAATVSAGAATADITVSSITNNVAVKAAYAYALNDFRAALGGTLGTPDTSGALTAIDQNQIAFGARWANDTNQLNGHLRRFQFYPVALPSATLTALTS